MTALPDFSITHLEFPDFLTLFQNSLTFDTFSKFPDFSLTEKVSYFHVLQCRWEPCNKSHYFTQMLSSHMGMVKKIIPYNAI